MTYITTATLGVAAPASRNRARGFHSLLYDTATATLRFIAAWPPRFAGARFGAAAPPLRAAPRVGAPRARVAASSAPRPPSSRAKGCAEVTGSLSSAASSSALSELAGRT